MFFKRGSSKKKLKQCELDEFRMSILKAIFLKNKLIFLLYLCMKTRNKRLRTSCCLIISFKIAKFLHLPCKLVYCIISCGENLSLCNLLNIRCLNGGVCDSFEIFWGSVTVVVFICKSVSESNMYLRWGQLT